ncbi:glucan synthesis regulatory protein [Cryptococcus neoformans C23]|uniref:Glucan synthesis regulatory protein n=1 Tax=Cryptococcus neoformans (strain H99 / ATCC 208821 / CBS 10515 / FGSC 9487) TaxID=235443 RepID=J9VXJ5_CRYN9|nr:glucan synthesis regulatory protein [Cryptococcus neoformans var. grubii H99]AUB28240.1 glucan synthesis regulatory protein [Cryptococcus neoformans var. grubii]OWZ33824.1 glucan synthesis regulatory protein [Cryptococcus neoformans var. grubii AD2-60a]OWZ45952.1 glucan synthesis regulatory protein [Cryptococcus neoformans var. grubii C23]OXC81722.1 glucan synthesis regulatory protein [Cryptococcus neoformans var. grubii AD1-7a]OXG36927.1 glucan synthesis regulatory protein [Cryptococcus ne|eukprot:XP_012052507.1 glucan synthesis regulatory protein [Cryptococcus neoformans var. grubii H99]
MPFLQSISSLFSGNSSKSNPDRYNNRRSVMDSTRDAFSLPTTNAGKVHYGNGYNDGPQLDSASSSPGPSRRNSNAYNNNYPPKNFSANPNSYPPLTHTFHRLRKTLAGSFPELLETLNPPVNPALLATFEAELGCPLPRSVRESIQVADGQDLEATANISGSGGLFYGLYFLPLEEVMREWAFWRYAEDDPTVGGNPAILATMASVPPQWIKTVYACKGWVPLLSDRTGNYVGVDLDPGPNGSWGQVIVFGRDFDRKCVLWMGDGEGGWGKWLAAFVDELQSGEGWEADKTASSDEEEEIGYNSYNGGGTYGEAGSGLRLAGQYRGWSVLEAWWDRSVRKWESLGLGLDIEEVERGLEEARRLTGYGVSATEGKGKGKVREGTNGSTSNSNSPLQETLGGSPHLAAVPGTPVPRDSDVLLPPSSPEQPTIPKIRHPSPSPARVITPVTSTTDHPLKPGPSPTVSGSGSGSGYLSPPTHSPPRRRRAPAPAPTPIDLPTRADIQAMSAIAQAEVSGLRGGWVMNLDTSVGSAARRASRLSSLGSGSQGRGSMDAEMVDIDLEGGRAVPFGSPNMTEDELERQREEERMAHAGLEHRRSPVMLTSRTPSPLARSPRSPHSPLSPHSVSFHSPHSPYSSRSPSFETRTAITTIDDPSREKTPKASLRSPNAQSPLNVTAIPQSVLDATSMIRPPPPVANNSSLTIRGYDGEERDRSLVRANSGASSGRRSPRPERSGTTPIPGSGPTQQRSMTRGQRESSVISTDSHDGLLESGSYRRSMSPVSVSDASALEGEEVLESPSTIKSMDSEHKVKKGKAGLEEEFQEVSL